MTPSDLPTYMREILAEEAHKRGVSIVSPTQEHDAALVAAMHRVYLDIDEGRSLREAKNSGPGETHGEDHAPLVKSLRLWANHASVPDAVSELLRQAADLLSPAQRTSIHLPDRERTPESKP